MEEIFLNKESEFDVVIPKNNEAEYVKVAVALGTKKLIFLTNNLNYKIPESVKNIAAGVVLKKGFFLTDTSVLNAARKNFDFVFASADRKFFELKIDFILDSELSSKRDSFHYKATSLNQVHAELAEKNNTTIVFGFDNLLNNPAETFGKMSQNATLVNKYSLRYSVVNMSHYPELMRSRTILSALGSVLGLK